MDSTDRFTGSSNLSFPARDLTDCDQSLLDRTPLPHHLDYPNQHLYNRVWDLLLQFHSSNRSRKTDLPTICAGHVSQC